MSSGYEVLNSDESIKSVIDSVNYLKKEHRLVINGWAFDEREDKVNFTVKEKELSVEIMKRADVYNAFDCKFDQALLSGFVIDVNNVNTKDAVLLEIKSKSGNAVIKFNVKEILYSQKREKAAFIKSLINKEAFFKAFSYMKRFGLIKTIKKIKSILNKSNAVNEDIRYLNWRGKFEDYNENKVKKEIAGFKYKPLISICIPVYNVEEKWLRLCLDSVINQYYENWQVCLADDCSTQVKVKEILEEYSQKDSRIKAVYRTENGHISRATNSAVEIAEGEFIALMDNDDEIPKWALYEVVKLLNEYPEADLIYSDEDKISMNGKRTDPHFKPDYSPDTLLSCNYISHLGVYRSSILKEIGGFRVGFEGSQDYDLVLRFTEKTKNIYHIPKILYHWRIIEGSTALGGGEKSYAFTAGFRALEEAIKRREYNAGVYEIENIPYYDVRFYPDKNYLISIIIPTKDKADILEQCLKSIYEKSTYKNYEIIVVDNNSEEKETFELFEKYKKYDNFRVLEQKIPFNYSKINNAAAAIANGELLLFLNNDIEVISEDWLERMAGEACRKEIGAVGVKLLYPNNTVQHGGVVLLGGKWIANHIGLGLRDDDYGYFATLYTRRNYSAVTAACMMIKKSVFEEIGGFEEKLTVAYNDVDLCLKAVKAGYYNLYIGGVKLYHYESLSRGYEDSPEKIKRLNEEMNYMIDNWGDLLEKDPCYNPDSELRLAERKTEA